MANYLRRLNEQPRNGNRVTRRDWAIVFILVCYYLSLAHSRQSGGTDNKTLLLQIADALREDKQGDESVVAQESSDSSASQDAVHIMPSCRGRSHFTEWNETSQGNKDKWDAVEALIPVLDEAQVDYFAICGTLLGFARGCRIFDKDLDFGVSLQWAQEPGNLDRFEEKLKKAGFRRTLRYRGLHNKWLARGSELRYHYKKVQIDFFFLDWSSGFDMPLSIPQKPSMSYHYGFHLGKRMMISITRPVDRVEAFQWGNLTVRVPMPYEDVLRAEYGDDWRTPRGLGQYQSTMINRSFVHGSYLIAKDETERAEEAGEAELVACLSDLESVIYARALATSMLRWNSKVKLELFHEGLPNVLTELFEQFPFVNVTDLFATNTSQTPEIAGGGDNLSVCHIKALQSARLRHVLLIKPSIIFLEDPSYILNTARWNQYSSKECTECSNPNGSCVTTTDVEATEELLGKMGDQTNSSRKICMVHTYFNYSMTEVTLKDDTPKEIARIHQTAHRVAAWAALSRTYSSFVETDELSPHGSLLLRGGTMPPEYNSLFQSHRLDFLEAKGRVMNIASSLPALGQPEQTLVYNAKDDENGAFALALIP